MKFLLLIALNASVLTFCLNGNTDDRWRIRLLLYPLLMNSLYLVMDPAIAKLDRPLIDDVLQGLDRWLLGGRDPVLVVQNYIHPVVTEILSFSYLGYFFYLLSSQFGYLRGDLETLKSYSVGLFSIYALGYLGYAMVPALGPHVAMADKFSAPLGGGWFTSLTEATVHVHATSGDAFPSLHVANAVFILFFDRAHKPARFRRYWPLCMGLIVATVYLRYHYLADVLCGVCMSMLGLRLAGRHIRTFDYEQAEVRSHDHANRECTDNRSLEWDRPRGRSAVRP